MTALMMAAYKGGHNETVKTLIAAGADLNILSVEVTFACLLLHVYAFITDNISHFILVNVSSNLDQLFYNIHS